MNSSTKVKVRVTSLLFILTVAVVLSTTARTGAHGSRDHAARLAERLERALVAKRQTFQFTHLRNITVDPAMAAAGGAFLIRSKNGLTAQVMAADLEPGHAYTFWWIIFNKPHLCAQAPCALSDRPTAGGATLYASGVVAGDNGTANVSFSTTSGGPPEGAEFAPALPAPGLMTNRGFRAEVHIVLIDHGIPTLPDLTSSEPDVPGTWAWELTHSLPFGPTWARAVIFRP